MRIFQAEWCEKRPPLDDAGDVIHDAAEYHYREFPKLEMAEKFARRQLKTGPNFYGCVHIREFERQRDEADERIGELVEVSSATETANYSVRSTVTKTRAVGCCNLCRYVHYQSEGRGGMARWSKCNANLVALKTKKEATAASETIIEAHKRTIEGMTGGRLLGAKDFRFDATNDRKGVRVCFTLSTEDFVALAEYNK